MSPLTKITHIMPMSGHPEPALSLAQWAMRAPWGGNVHEAQESWPEPMPPGLASAEALVGAPNESTKIVWG